MTAANPAILQLFVSGAFTDVPLLASERIVITRGQDPDGAWPRPAKIECTINNDTLAWDPSLPGSPLYGLAGRNTQMRIRIPSTVTRAWAEATTWEPDATPEHVPGVRGRASVKLVGEGVLARLGLWSDPLRSPMYRTISTRTTSIGHWSLEDDRDALTLDNSVSTGGSATFDGLTLAESDTPLGAEQSVKISAGSQMTGAFAAASTTAGWQMAFSMRLAALPPSATYVLMFRWKTSNGYSWFWDVNNTTYRINVRDSDGTLLYTANVGFGAGAEPNQWVTFRLRAEQIGGNVSAEYAWYAQGLGFAYGSSGTFAGLVGALRQWWQEGNATTADGHFVHVFGVTGLTDDLLSATARSVFDGYRGERALDRFHRLMGELGIGHTQVGGSESEAMGPQRADTVLSLLREIVLTDDCLIYDAKLNQPELTIRGRRDMYALTAALTLNYPADVAIPFRKIIGSQAIRNRVTVKNASGGELTATQSSGPMSVLPPPAGVGEVKAGVDVSVNNESVQLPLRASWELAKGTLPRPRYTEITVDLLKNPGLAAAAKLVEPGDRINVIGKEPDPIMLRCCGIVDAIEDVPWSITFQVDAYEPWDVGIWDDAAFRWDARTSTLAVARDAVQTSWSVTCTDIGDVWTTAAGSFPFDWMVAGERVRVTAMTAPAGAGPYTQTATVTRSVNGVVKGQLVGAVLELADPKRWGY
jgi:hypothetical protein